MELEYQPQPLTFPKARVPVDTQLELVDETVLVDAPVPTAERVTSGSSVLRVVPAA